MARGRLDDATIVFDLDGTLVDSAPDLAGALNAVLIAADLDPLRLDLARSMIGSGARALLAHGFAAAGRTLAPFELNDLFPKFIEQYRAHIADLTTPYPGVFAALDDLTAAGARLAVCTNKRTDLSLALLEAVGLSGRFAAVVGPDEAPAAKPDPRHLLAAIAAAGGNVERAIIVGDSVSDAGAARAAGTPLVLVDFGYSETPAGELGADILIDHFDQLPAACARLLGAPNASPSALSALGSSAIGPSPAGDGGA